MALITLLSDFGTADGFVGAMKGAILSLSPSSQVIDLSHDVARGNIRAGAWALACAAKTFPAGTVHVAVVDPGVGTERRPILLRAADQLYVAPDNGLVSWVDGIGSAEGWCLDRAELFRSPLSHTFHGRDIFASVAGHLAAGLDPSECGSVITDWRLLSWPAAQVEEHRIVGCVVHVDRFGNLVTNIHAGSLGNEARWQVSVGRRSIGPLKHTFGDVDTGAWVAYVGSTQYVEVAIRDGDAAEMIRTEDCEITLCRPS